MKVIVAGSRSIRLYTIVEKAINRAFNQWLREDLAHWKLYIQPEIVSGGAYGVDFFGEQYANKHKLPLKVFPADWDRFGKSAGIRRNLEMSKYADRLIAVWDGQSRGTQHMINCMQKAAKPVYIHKETNEN